MKTITGWCAIVSLVCAGVCAKGAVTLLEYADLSYGAFFATGVTPNNHQLEIKFRESATASGAYVFGVSQNGNNFRLRSSADLWYWGVNGTEYNAPYWTPGDHTLVFNDTVNHRVTMDGLNLGTASGAASTGKLYLGRHYNTQNFAGRIYYCKLTTSAGVLVFDWRPATQNGQVGFFDRVSSTFVAPAGGTVAAGPALHGELTVTGAPLELAAGLNPAYGVTNGLATNASFTVSAPAEYLAAPELRYTCAGWKLYTYDDTTGDFVLDTARTNATGTGNSFTYIHTGVASKLEWQWTASDPTAGADWYVAEFGNDANDGQSWATARRTIQTAIDAAATDDLVLVAPGRYYAGTATSSVQPGTGMTSIPVALYLNKKITVRSVTGWADTIVDARGTSGSVRIRNAEVCATGALLAGFSLINGSNGGIKTPLSGVLVSFGTLSNCLFNVKGTRASQVFKLINNARAFDIVMGPMACINTGGEGDVIVSLENTSVMDGFVMTNQYYGATSLNSFILMTGDSTLRNALIAGNRLGQYASTAWKPILGMGGTSTKLENGTIADNFVNAADGAVQISGTKSIVTNCIVYGNANTTGVNPDFHNAANLTKVYTTCSRSLVAGERGNITTNPQFADSGASDYSLRVVSKCVDAGGAPLEAGDPNGGRTDVAGNPRLAGAAVDLGCYEQQTPVAGAPVQCAFEPSVTRSAAGEPLEVTFTGFSVGSTMNLSAAWDFGDGATSTDWPNATHVYATPGAYTVTLTVSSDGGTDTCTLEDGIFIVPATCYVKEGNTGVFPYDTWEKATPILADAVAVGPGTVIVTNGTYIIQAPFIPLGSKITVKSVEGPAQTILDSLPGNASTCHRHFTILHDEAVVSGFTLKNGWSSYGQIGFFTPSVEMSAGWLTNCVIKGQQRVSRSPAFYAYGTARVVDCEFDGTGLAYDNQTEGTGGPYIAGNAVVDRCRIHHYAVPGYNTTQLRGAVMLNSAGAVLRNSLVHHCSFGAAAVANDSGVVAIKNGRVENCTIVENACGGYGGGVRFYSTTGALVNSIVYNNTATMGANDLYAPSAGPSITYSCASDFSGVAGGMDATCTVNNPNFSAEAGQAYHLSLLSAACLDRATTNALAWITAAGAVDLDHNPRIDVQKQLPDLGCFEFVYSEGPVPLDATIDVLTPLGRAPLDASFEATIIGGGEAHTLVWDFGDNTTDTTTNAPTHTYSQPGVYDVSFTVTSGEETKTLVVTGAVTVVGPTCYVSTSGASVPPYLTWETAATNVLDAVALNPPTVLVTNGAYNVSGEGIMISSDLQLRSVGGPAVTMLRGTRELYPGAPSSKRLFWINHADGVIDGFSFTRGYSGTWDDSIAGKMTAGLLSHCVISNYCGGNYRSSVFKADGSGCRIEDCVFDLRGVSGNADGAYFCAVALTGGAVMDRCVVKRMDYTTQGGATVAHHAAVHVVGHSVLRNSLIVSNVVTQTASITANGVRTGAVVVYDSGTVENCTLVGNRAYNDAGGLTMVSSPSSTPVVRNNIVWDNTSTGAGPVDVCEVSTLTSPDGFAAAPRIAYSCASDLAHGADGNITNAPLFVLKGDAPFTPSKTSPCLNTADYQAWMDGATDLAGNPRLRNRLPDMGCYEGLLPGATMLLLR